MNQTELFIDFYQNVKDDNWPEYEDLIKLDPIPLPILHSIINSFQTPDEVDPTLKNQIICQSLGIDSIPKDAFDGERIAELERIKKNRADFVDFYNSFKTNNWPDVDTFLSLESKPFDVVEDILANWNHHEHNDFINQLLHVNTYVPLHHAGIEMHNYFFWSTVDFYRQRPDIFSQLDRQLPKPKFFDVLLGRRKHHRDLVYRNINHQRNIVTYMSEDESLNLTFCNHQNFIWPEEIIDAEGIDITDTASIVRVNGVIVSLSQIIPVSIYNQTAYSLVCESQCENNFSFFTEKIIKPMLAKRLFLVCSGRYFLKNLRSLGFQTFDGIIDESYDAEWQLERRVESMLAQCDYLYQQDQQAIYQQAQPILEHNFNLLMSTDWQKEMISVVTGQIKKYF